MRKNNMENQIKLKNKVLVLGSSYNTLKDAPIDNQDYTIIALSGFQNSCVDIYFEMHDRKVWSKETQEYLKSCNKPIFCQKKQSDIESSRLFPMVDCFKVLKIDYFTSSIAYILGFLFMSEDVEEISIYGVDLTAKEEYQEQRPCVEYLLGRLEGKGIKISIPKKSALLKSNYLYGYENKPQGILELDYFVSRQEGLFQERNELLNQAKRLDGAIRENEQHIANYQKIQRGGSFLE